MIRKSGNRFSLGTNAKRWPADHAQQKMRLETDSSQLNRSLAGLARGLHRIASVAADQRGVLSDRRGLADKIALHRIATFIREETELFLGFHAFGDDRHFEAVAKADDGGNDRRPLPPAAPLLHQRRT